MTQNLRFRPFTRHSISQAPQWAGLSLDRQTEIDVVSRVLPFRVNQYVLDNLIDWGNVPNDPMYRLTFPHSEMLKEDDYNRIKVMIRNGSSDAEIEKIAMTIRLGMNPHPAGQVTHNVPVLNGKALPGIQHKYRETVLFFPSAGQSCHAYCTFCFRWPQFVGMEELKFNSRDAEQLVEYLQSHEEVTDVLLTGGDPMVMNTRALAGYIEPLLNVPHIRNIRIGTKAVAYWPQRFVTDLDADNLMRLFERVIESGRSLALMAHFNHPREIQTQIARKAIRRIITTGATVRFQAPVIRHVNEDPNDWAKLWTEGVQLGAVPYYMFVERDTGPSHYFKLPIAKAYEIFRLAYTQVSGLARTVRGPSMSAFPGKIVIDGVVEIGGQKLFALQYLQARNSDLVRRPFHARFNPHATWFDELEPAFKEDRAFFESAYKRVSQEGSISARKLEETTNV